MNIDSDQRMNSMKDEIKAFTERIVFQNAEKIIEAKHKSEMLLEGRCNAFAVELEKKYKDMFTQFKEGIEIADIERRINTKKLEEELADQLKKMKLEQ